MAQTFKILLDPGHGPGKAHNRGGLYFNEGDNAYDYSLVLKKRLETIPNVKVDLTRSRNGNPSLSKRSRMGTGYDLFLSLHSNAGTRQAKGVEIWLSVNRKGQTLAKDLVQAITRVFKTPNRGVKYKKLNNGADYYGVLRNNWAKVKMIVEHGFHTNPQDGKTFRDKHQEIANATAKVIENHYNLGKGKPVTSNARNYAKKGDIHDQANTTVNIKEFQGYLKELGYNVEPNGHFGTNTEKAVKDFQSKYKQLKVNGAVGPKTIKELRSQTGSSKPTQDSSKPSIPTWYGIGSPYNTKAKVRELQKDLESLGFGVGSWGTNGVMGPDTANAIGRFQKANGLTVDKQAGPDTLKKLKERTRNRGASLSVDGFFGKATTKALQRYFKTLPDGIISGQYPNRTTRAIYSADFSTRTGSNVIRALQGFLGINQDGYVGPNTVKALQRRFNTPVDGIISQPSTMVKELQRRLNRGKL